MYKYLLLLILLPLLFSCAEQSLTVKVIVPAGTPDSSEVYITGNREQLGFWNPSKVKMVKESDSIWVFTGSFKSGDTLEFKITRGNWNSQAMETAGIMPGNTRIILDSDKKVVIRFQTWSDIWFASHSGIVGEVNYYRGLKGEGLNFPKDVIVWLPSSYKENKTKRYPVLYMHDGQNVFDPATSFNGTEWRIDEVADSLAKAGIIEEIIVVALSNSADRTAEYSDTELGKAYLNFVTDKIKPMIDSTYRTLKGPESTAVMGSSMGGLSSFLFVWWRPDVFGMAGCLSSAFLIEDYKIIKEVDTFEGERKNFRVYMDDGTEGLENQLRPGYDQMLNLLKTKGYQDSTEVMGYIDEGAEHTERAWSRRVWRPLEFMFGVKK
ncbi:MAG: histidine kinase [Bacteroidetes bacterium]|nr:histidine kinase [Bacteroidota bacterium]MCA0446533.1 histidine kinase [Bacteroidota bacterium]